MPTSYFCILLLIATLATNAAAQISFNMADRATVESRLKSYGGNNAQREQTVKKMFADAGCKQVSEEEVNHLPPNVICILPGQTDEIILVGAHTDRVDVGDGVVDNWSSASLLASLFYSENVSTPRHHTFMFVGFTGEEKELLGSKFYVEHLSAEQRKKIVAMVNMDTLALGPTEVWASHADKQLLDPLAIVANSLKLPISVMNVDNVGTTDSESFAQVGIPRVTLHSVTQATWPILHSSKDNMSAVKMDDYYDSYHLIAAYLAFLDGYLKTSPQAVPH
ncbi:MAG TPA: M28 family peptidase [Terriglobales bacterium]|jgi:hypothetical protein